MSTSTRFLLWMALAAPAVVLAEPGVHTHGDARLQLALAGDALEIDLTVPGMDAVGFEHAPRDDAQRAALAAAVAKLEASPDWLAFEPAGACTVTEASAHGHGYDAEHDAQDGGDHGAAHGDAHAHDHDHDHQADHDHDHDAHAHGEGDDHAHAELHLTLHAHCAQPPVAVSLGLVEAFPALQRVRVEYVTDGAQGQVDLRGSDQRVALD